jgi:hypothetical protein
MLKYGTGQQVAQMLDSYMIMMKNSVYGNFNHRYNVSPSHLHAFFWFWENLSKVVRMCVDRQ